MDVVEQLARKVAQLNLSDLSSVSPTNDAVNADAASPAEAMQTMMANRKPDGRYLSVANMADPKPVDTDITGMAQPPNSGMMTVEPHPQPPMPQQPPQQPMPAAPQQGPPAPMPPQPAPAQPAPMQAGPPPAAPQPAPLPQPPPMPQAPQQKVAFMFMPPLMHSPYAQAVLGQPRQDETTLTQNFGRQEELIKNLAGQLNPNSGKPYSPKEIMLKLNDLAATTNRAKNTRKLLLDSLATKDNPAANTSMQKKAYFPMPGVGGTPFMYQPNPAMHTGMPMLPNSFAQGGFNHASGLNSAFGLRPGVTPGANSPMNSLNGLSSFSGVYPTSSPSMMYTPPMPLQTAGFGYNPLSNMGGIGSYPGYSGGYFPGSYINPLGLPGSGESASMSRSRANEIRNELDLVRNQRNQAELSSQMINDPEETLRKYQAAVETMRTAASNTTAAEPEKHIDPLTGKPLRFRLNPEQLKSWYLNPFGSSDTWHRSDWQAFQEAKQQVANLEPQIELIKNQRQRGVKETADPRIDRLSTRMRDFEGMEDQEYHMQRDMRQRMINQFMNPFGQQQPGQQPAQPPAQQSGNQALPPLPSRAAPQTGTTSGGQTAQPNQSHAPAQAPRATPQLPQQPTPQQGAGTTLASNTLANNQTKQSSVLQKSAFRALASRLWHDPNVSTALTTMGAGSLLGAGVGAMSAPHDYMLDGAIRGAKLGLIGGAGATAGGIVGTGAGRLSAHMVNAPFRRQTSSLARRAEPFGTARLPVNPETAGSIGMYSGAIPAGLLTTGLASQAIGQTPWDKGDTPLLERIDLMLRNKPAKVEAKSASAKAASIADSAKEQLKAFGLLSDREKQKLVQNDTASKSRDVASYGLRGAAAGGLAGGLLEAIKRSRPLSIANSAAYGSAAGVIPGSLLGMLRANALAKEMTRPTNTFLERRFPNLNPQVKE